MTTFRPRYALLTIACLATIYWLSTRPDLGTAKQNELMRLISNLMHAPFFAALAFCCLKATSVRQISWKVCGVVILASAACGALLEWYQSFVPGRRASVGDVLMDLAGTCAMLLALRMQALRANEGSQSTPSVS